MLPGLLLALAGAACGDPACDFSAPANRWTTRGGGPAHSGASLTSALRGPVETVWRHDAGAEIEGEPLVWDDQVVLALNKGLGQRALRVLDLASGERLMPDLAVPSEVTLEPALWRNTIVLRSAKDEIKSVRIRGSRMTEQWTLHTQSQFHPPLLVDDRIYVATGDDVRCFAVGHRDPLWTSTGLFRSPVSASPDGLSVLSVEKDERFVIVQLDSRTGRERARVQLPDEARPLARSGRPLELTLLPSASFASAWSVSEQQTYVLGVDRGTHPGFAQLAPAMTSVPALAGPGWIAHVVDGKDVPMLLLVSDPKERGGFVMASPRQGLELVAKPTPVTVVGPVAYIGPLACEFDSGRVLWRLRGMELTQRPVPARETVLYVDHGRFLCAVRARGSRVRQVAAEVSDQHVQGTLVSRDGSVTEGEFDLEAAQKRAVLTGKTGGETWRLADILLLEDSSRHIVLAADPLRGLVLLAEERCGKKYFELAKDARRANDPELLETFVDRAFEYGADEKELAPLRTLADNQRRSTKRPDASLVAQLTARRDQITRVPVDLMWESFQAQDAAQRGEVDVALLRGILTRDPKHAQARESVRALLPEKLRPSGEFDALDALSLIEAVRVTKIEIVPAPPEDELGVLGDPREVRMRVRNWRPDVYGIRSENLMIVTPVREHGRLARCLALGELVCKTLASFFPDGKIERNARKPLLIELCATRDEYLQRVTAATGGDPSKVEWTAGLYEPLSNVTRVYAPESDDEFERSLSAIAHEVTHHWLEVRCPQWPYRSFSERAADQREPGFWIVEGFANLVGDFGFDVAHEVCSIGGAESKSLDLVSNAPPGMLLPWQQILDCSHAFFLASIPKSGGESVPSSTLLGRTLQATPGALFYAQSTALARYLFEAQSGELRPLLFEFLEAYYTGEAASFDLPKRLGLQVDELGARVVAHARKVISG